MGLGYYCFDACLRREVKAMRKRIVWTALVLGALAGGVGLAGADPIVYQPVQYQYGAHGEIFYGGQNPNFQANPYNFVSGVGFPNALGTAGGRFVGPSPAYRFERFDARNVHGLPPLVYSDLMPYVEVGQYGYTSDDARNEAYANVPRYQVKGGAPAAAPPEVAVPAPAAVPVDVRPKAIPLLTWARGAHSRGETELVNALLLEAAKYDPVATAKVRAELK
jgi:hypothetical protein